RRRVVISVVGGALIVGIASGLAGIWGVTALNAGCVWMILATSSASRRLRHRRRVVISVVGGALIVGIASGLAGIWGVTALNAG
ncbi:hypothetical protein CQA81_31350, partial [Klebsiella pneumoniae]